MNDLFKNTCDYYCFREEHREYFVRSTRCDEVRFHKWKGKSDGPAILYKFNKPKLSIDFGKGALDITNYILFDFKGEIKETGRNLHRLIDPDKPKDYYISRDITIEYERDVKERRVLYSHLLSRMRR